MGVLPPELGDEVSGIYKKQPFTGRVTRHFYSDISGAKGITFRFHKAVDVATSKHFSNLRQNVSIIMGKDGISLDHKGRADGLLILNQTLNLA